ncbi:hypothetical protein [Hyalangium gracile]|uniref:hypothetical protein n=1 Tax=Hyalangium gracile TaxID=394092 RepID=UPI001CCB8C6F|nr:hypothetical protein [Hyalangium gracile]
MQTTRTTQGHLSTSQAHTHEGQVVPPLMVLLVSLAAGCGMPEESTDTSWQPEQQLQEVEGDNGLSVNGLSVNGLSVNGLSVNGLSVNGLSATSFQSWFQGAPAQANSVMSYVVLCAAPAGQTFTYTDATTGQGYSWSGKLGLAPGWASGLPATVAEQQVVSACLAAHVNKYGVHVSISMLGRNGDGQTIPYSSLELSTHARREACLFGNLFTGQGIYVGNDGPALSSTQSSSRACTLADGVNSARAAECSPLTPVGSCDSYCTLDPSGTFYTSCTYNGVTYQPLTTRLRSQDIYECGDGICQVTESCGTSNTYDSCQVDCGACK